MTAPTAATSHDGPESSTSDSGGSMPITSVAIAPAITTAAGGDGDLWPNCWGPDDAIYTAHGDGRGFSSEFADIGVDVIAGEPGALVGRTVAAGDQVGQIWTEGGNHNRKPTGMACVDSTLYLAIQDLALNFDDAPAASISRSDDGGQTWTWDRSGPMFSGGVFTTVIFLDYGKDYAAAPDGYVYAYGLDHNWRASFSDTVPHPVDLYLGRVPRDSVQDRTSWEFYAGLTADDAPIWSRDIGRRAAVLHDARTVHHDGAGALEEHTVISQGGIVYNAPLRRYLYTSWTEFTFEFYQAPAPWGPWRAMASKDFGRYPWTLDSYGGYATTIPSKYISADGGTMWLQSNVCPCADAGVSIYDFSLRPLTLSIDPVDPPVGW